jgi:hypothetical protein
VARTKVLLTIDPDVLRVIDARADHHHMTRSAYLAAAGLGLLKSTIDDDEPVDPSNQEPEDQT